MFRYEENIFFFFTDATMKDKVLNIQTVNFDMILLFFSLFLANIRDVGESLENLFKTTFNLS